MEQRKGDFVAHQSHWFHKIDTVHVECICCGCGSSLVPHRCARIWCQWRRRNHRPTHAKHPQKPYLPSLLLAPSFQLISKRPSRKQGSIGYHKWIRIRLESARLNFKEIWFHMKNNLDTKVCLLYQHLWLPLLLSLSKFIGLFIGWVFIEKSSCWAL